MIGLTLLSVQLVTLSTFTLLCDSTFHIQNFSPQTEILNPLTTAPPAFGNHYPNLDSTSICQ